MTASPTARRQSRERQERLELIEQKVKDGTLTILEATPQERERWQANVSSERRRRPAGWARPESRDPALLPCLRRQSGGSPSADEDLLVSLSSGGLASPETPRGGAR